MLFFYLHWNELAFVVEIPDPIEGITSISDILEDVETASPGAVDLSNLTRYFRYSTNNIDWSLWYDFTPTSIDPNGLDSVKGIELDPDHDVYIQIKCDFGTLILSPYCMAIS